MCIRDRRATIHETSDCNAGAHARGGRALRNDNDPCRTKNEELGINNASQPCRTLFAGVPYYARA
eukprot:6724172-Lingulodinium_polyedra.AAC.1